MFLTSSISCSISDLFYSMTPSLRVVKLHSHSEKKIVKGNYKRQINEICNSLLTSTKNQEKLLIRNVICHNIWSWQFLLTCLLSNSTMSSIAIFLENFSVQAVHSICVSYLNFSVLVVAQAATHFIQWHLCSVILRIVTLDSHSRKKIIKGNWKCEMKFCWKQNCSNSLILISIKTLQNLLIRNVWNTSRYFEIEALVDFYSRLRDKVA